MFMGAVQVGSGGKNKGCSDYIAVFKVRHFKGKEYLKKKIQKKAEKTLDILLTI